MDTSAAQIRKVARVLLQLADESGVVTPRGVAVQFDVAKHDVATHLGMTRIEATLAVNALKHAGALNFEGSTLLVDPEVLRSFL